MVRGLFLPIKFLHVKKKKYDKGWQDTMTVASATPKAIKQYTSYSGLSTILNWILNIPAFFGDERFLLFGRQLHSMWLEAKKSVKGLTKEEQGHIDNMVKSLNAHKFAMKLHKGAKKEFRFDPMRKLGNVLIKVIIDIYKPGKYGADLKSTSARSEEAFIQNAIDFGYFKQAVIYMLIGKLPDFYFIGVQKKPPYNVFILDVRKYPKELAEARKQIDFLVYLFEHHKEELQLLMEAA